MPVNLGKPIHWSVTKSKAKWLEMPNAIAATQAARFLVKDAKSQQNNKKTRVWPKLRVP